MPITVWLPIVVIFEFKKFPEIKYLCLFRNFQLIIMQK